MAYIKLKVTSKVLEQSKRAVNQEQIAITDVSGVIATPISNANKRNQVSLTIGHIFKLKVGGRHAIWKVHNSHNKKGFESLFGFLSKHPDQEFKFQYSIF